VITATRPLIHCPSHRLPLFGARAVSGAANGRRTNWYV
jgi:hypothetical protein